MSTERALEAIKRRGPISAKDLAVELNTEEKVARGLIDRLRATGEPIWNDTRLRAFWWRDDLSPSSIPFERWKRPFEP
jgi:hypothetical protein